MESPYMAPRPPAPTCAHLPRPAPTCAGLRLTAPARACPRLRSPTRACPRLPTPACACRECWSTEEPLLAAGIAAIAVDEVHPRGGRGAVDEGDLEGFGA